jgi:hypothetical protein
MAAQLASFKFGRNFKTVRAAGKGKRPWSRAHRASGLGRVGRRTVLEITRTEKPALIFCFFCIKTKEKKKKKEQERDARASTS